jgi:hypothetical protein
MPTSFIGMGDLFPGDVHFWIWHNAVYRGNYSFIAWPRRAVLDPEPHPVQVNTEIVNVAEVGDPGGPFERQVLLSVTNTGGFCRYDLFISFDPPPN